MLFFISFFLFLQDGKLCRYNWRGRTPTQRKKNGDVMNVTRFFFGFCCFQVMAEEKSRCWIMWHQQLFFSGVGGGGMKRKMDRIGIILEQQSERKRSCVLYRVGSFHERTNSNVKTKRNEDINVKRSKWSFNITKTVRSILFILSNCLCPMMGFFKSFFERCCAICGRCNLCFWFDARVQFFFIDIEVVIYDRRTSENGPNLNAL